MKDNERRLKGAMPDGFLKLQAYNLIMALMEVSWPSNAKDHAHFLKQEGDHELYQEIKLYGLQFYDNKLHLYSLCQPAHGLYVYEEELNIDLEVGFLANFVPRICRKLAIMQTLLAQCAESIKAYINSDSMGNSSECSSN
ncbi:hypothetical protein BCR43DRAFT_509489 [Syncephalastrum racemosum]|uniref:Uncharacterized protein n=1 Tax=Syncephalastrum racemosum TaxID=13706 RepID=A0A1X2HS53_SYNRA|nr:hypothetical protein BCR43DRAFT_509489 [Syncephalastrum racemosum]